MSVNVSRAWSLLVAVFALKMLGVKSFGALPLSTLSAVLAPPHEPWRGWKLPLSVPRVSLPRLPSLNEGGSAQALETAANLSSKIVLQLYFEKMRASSMGKVRFDEISVHSPISILVQYADEQGIVCGAKDGSQSAEAVYHKILRFGTASKQLKGKAVPSIEDTSIVGSTMSSGRAMDSGVSTVRIPGVDFREQRLEESRMLGREAELFSASTADGKGGCGASLQLLQALGLSADDAFCELSRTLRLMGVAHRLDFTTYKGRVFPDVVLTDMRDDARLVLELDDGQGGRRVEGKKRRPRGEGESGYLAVKRAAMEGAGYRVVVLRREEWPEQGRHAERVALLAAVLANAGFW